MLQRIQTIYLLIILILSAINALCPILDFASTNNEFYQLKFTGFYHLTSDGTVVLEQAWTLSALLAIIPLITLITINLFKHRMLQIRLTIFNSLLMLGYYGMVLYFMYYFNEKYDCTQFLQWTIIIPAICIVFNYLAIRSIGKDMALIKSLDRIR